MSKKKKIIASGIISLLLLSSGAVGLGVYLGTRSNNQQNITNKPINPIEPPIIPEDKPLDEWDTSELLKPNGKFASQDLLIKNLVTNNNNFKEFRYKETDQKTTLKYKKDFYQVNNISTWPSQANPLQFGNEYPIDVYKQDKINFNGIMTDFRWDKFIESEIENETLKIHPSALNLTYMTPQDGATMIGRDYVISSEYRGNSVPLGAFLPAGEIMTITFDESITLQDIKNWRLEFFINEAYRDIEEPDQVNNVFNRPLRIMSHFNVAEFWDAQTNSIKIASPYGGGVTLRFGYVGKNLSMKPVKFNIDKLIPSPFYIHGQTTEQEWKWQLDNWKSPMVEFLTDNFTCLEPSHVQSKNEYPDRYYFYPKIAADFIDNSIRLSRYVLNQDNRWNSRHSMMMADYWIGGNGAAAVNFPSEWTCYVPWDWNPLLGSEFVPDINRYWGPMHEINHSFQFSTMDDWGSSWGFTESGEQTNNILNYIQFTTLGYLSDKRSERNPSAFGDEGWGRYGTPYNMFKIVNDSPTGQGELDMFRYVNVLYTLGIKTMVDWIRMNVNNATYHDSDEGNIDFILQLCELTKLNLIPFYESIRDKGNYQGTLPADWLTHSWALQRFDIIKTYPVYYPTVNLYANRQFIKGANGWRDSNIVQAPYRVGYNEKKTFEIIKYTKTYDSNIKYKNVKLLSNGQIGNAIQDGDNIIYQAKFTKNNQMDNLFFSVQDNLNNTYYFEIQITPNFAYNNILSKNYLIPTNAPELQQSMIDIAKGINKPNHYQTIYDEYITSDNFLVKESKQRVLYTWQTQYIPEEDGWLRFGGAWNQDILITVDNEEILHVGGQLISNDYFPCQSKPFKVEKNKPIEIKVYILNRNGQESHWNNIRLYEWKEGNNYDKNNNTLIGDAKWLKFSPRSIKPGEKLEENVLNNLKAFNPEKGLENFKYKNDINGGSVTWNGLDLFQSIKMLPPKPGTHILRTETPNANPEFLKGEYKLFGNPSNDEPFTVWFDMNKTKPEDRQVSYLVDLKENITFNKIQLKNVEWWLYERMSDQVEFSTFDNQGNEIILAPFTNYYQWKHDIPYATFAKPMTTQNKKLKITFRALNNGADSIGLKRFELSYNPDVNKVIDVNDPRKLIKFSGFESNGLSWFNSRAKMATKRGSKFEFEIDSNHFFLGSVELPKANFNVYEDGKLIQSVNWDSLLYLKDNPYFYHYIFQDSKNKRKITIELITDGNFQLDYVYF